MMSSIFKKTKKKHTEQPMFFGESVDIARYDIVKYPQIDTLTQKMLSFFWRPEEIDITKDKVDFKILTDSEEHIFTSNLKRQILLDSIQGRGPAIALLPYTSLPELEVLFSVWSMFEMLHSKSYTHIIRNVYANPSEVFDGVLKIKEILECADDISKYYDDFVSAGITYKLWDEKLSKSELLELKKRLWLMLNAINILEGIRFYVSFACSWNFAELKKMEGNAKIIKFICRDENLHLAASTHILKNLVKEDKTFVKIKNATKNEVTQMFVDAIEQEKAWAKYLFKDGSMIGLNENLLQDYAEWIGTKRMRTLGIKSPYTPGRTNPLPWTEKWISNGSVHVLPQEAEISSYSVGSIDQDGLDNLKGFKL